MRRFYEEYHADIKLRQLVAEIPWGQNLLILNKVKDLPARIYYLQTTLEMGWSRNILLHQIKSQAYERQQLIPKQHNFDEHMFSAARVEVHDGRIRKNNPAKQRTMPNIFSNVSPCLKNKIAMGKRSKTEMAFTVIPA